MIYLLPLSLLGLCLWWGPAARRQPALALFAAISGLGILLYASALLDLLRPTAEALFWFGIVSLGLKVYLAWRTNELSRIFRPAWVFFILGCWLLWPLMQGATLQFWDEFSHWGTMSKVLLHYDALPGEYNPLMFKDYPPGTNLLHYFAALNTRRAEDAFYLGQLLLLLGPALVLAIRPRWRQAGWSLLALFGVILLGVVLSVFICSLMVDALLGFYLGALLYAVWALRLTRRDLPLLIPPLLLLPLIKASGFFLAIMVLAALLPRFAAHIMRGPRHKRRTGSLILLLLLLAPFLSQQSWAWRVERFGGKPEAPPVSLSMIMTSLGSRASPEQQLVRDIFLRALAEQPLSNYRTDPGRSLLDSLNAERDIPLSFPALSFLGFAALALLPIAAAYSQFPASRRRLGCALGATIVFALIYLLGLYLLYQFSFNLHQAQTLVSFNRYVNTFLSALLLLFWAWSLPFYQRGKSGLFHSGALLLFFLGVLGQAPSWAEIPHWNGQGQVKAIRQELAPLAREIQQLTPPESKLFVVMQDSSGLALHILRYEIVPRETNGWFFSLGEPYGPHDHSTENLSSRQWADMLRDYDYVVLAKTDPSFWRQYGNLFAVPAARTQGQTVFKIQTTGAGIQLASGS